jgi:hypothetical protein
MSCNNIVVPSFGICRNLLHHITITTTITATFIILDVAAVYRSATLISAAYHCSPMTVLSLLAEVLGGADVGVRVGSTHYCTPASTVLQYRAISESGNGSIGNSSDCVCAAVVTQMHQHRRWWECRRTTTVQYGTVLHYT